MTRVKAPKASTSSQPAGPTKSGSKHKHLTQNHKHKGPDAQHLPGVQKIKASLRQTRRLLAKDGLAADVRVETERRLRSLEKDLSEAQRVRNERTIATRYHKIKFFERQKVSRKITQTKRELEPCSDKKEKKALKKRLFDQRVDLNYILHYPKTKKYISLFPPEVRSGEIGSLPSLAPEGDSAPPPSDKQREEIRKWIKDKMERNELSGEPEVEVQSRRRTISTGDDPQDAPGASATKKSHEAGSKADEEGSIIPTVEDDEFFGDDGGDEGGD